MNKNNGGSNNLNNNNGNNNHNGEEKKDDDKEAEDHRRIERFRSDSFNFESPYIIGLHREHSIDFEPFNLNGDRNESFNLLRSNGFNISKNKMFNYFGITRFYQRTSKLSNR